MITTVHPPIRHSSPTSWIEQLVPPDRQSPEWENGLHHLSWSMIRRGLMHRHSLTIHGEENFPESGPAVIVANHNSHLDTLLLGASIPRSARSRFSPLAAGDTFFRNPAQSWISSRFLNLRPIWRRKRGGHNLSRLRHSLTDQEACMLIFPEGSRSRSGSMGHFKPGVGMLVAGTSIPVIPCHIRGTFEAWPSSRRLPGKGALHLAVGKPQRFSSCNSTSSEWRDIAQSLESEVRGLGMAH